MDIKILLQEEKKQIQKNKSFLNVFTGLSSIYLKVLLIGGVFYLTKSYVMGIAAAIGYDFFEFLKFLRQEKKKYLNLLKDLMIVENQIKFLMYIENLRNNLENFKQVAAKTKNFYHVGKLRDKATLIHNELAIIFAEKNYNLLESKISDYLSFMIEVDEFLEKEANIQGFLLMYEQSKKKELEENKEKEMEKNQSVKDLL